METVKDYKQAIDEVCHTLWVFGYAVEAVAKPDNVTIIAIKEQWKLADLEVIANRCRGYNPKSRIKEELTKDTPTKEALRQRLDYVFFELQEQPAFADGCNYFPVFDEAFFSINNNQLIGALAAINGQTWAFKAVVQLENIVQWANFFVNGVVAMLNDLCKFAQYNVGIDTETNQQEAIKQPVTSKPQHQIEFSNNADTNKAIWGLLERLKAVGWIDDGYRWKKGATKQLIAYWVERVSLNFNLSNTYINENFTIKWKPFEQLFGLKDGTLKTAKQSWLKVNTLFTPTRYEEIEPYTKIE